MIRKDKSELKVDVVIEYIHVDDCKGVAKSKFRNTLVVQRLHILLVKMYSWEFHFINDEGVRDEARSMRRKEETNGKIDVYLFSGTADM